MNSEDQRLGMDRPITRRQFIEGAAASVATGALLAGCSSGSDATTGAATTGTTAAPADPTALTGMRGSTDASYAVMHAVRDRKFDPGTVTATGEEYDLVVIGAGISGLTAAYLYRRDVKADARILIIENHDDIGGHARRNEFDVNGTRLIGYGGTQSLEEPALYSPESIRVLKEIGIDTTRFEDEWFDTKFLDRHGLEPHLFFDRETFGEDVLVNSEDPKLVEKLPISPAGRRDLTRILTRPPDPFPGLNAAKKAERLSGLTYSQFLTRHLKAHPDVVKVYQQSTHGYFGLGIDAVSALDCFGMDLVPGFSGMRLPRKVYRGMGRSPALAVTAKQDYIYHFPDGNAGVVRALLHALIPDALPADTVEEQVLATVDYGRFDEPRAPVRIRLNSSVVKVSQGSDPGSARVATVEYSRDGATHSVTARAVVAACWHVVSARIIEGLRDDQTTALGDQVKVPLVYANVALTNWRAFAKLGISSVEVAGPGPGWHYFDLDYPVSIGDYRFSGGPDEPIIVHIEMTPNQPGVLPPRTQLRAGRAKLYAMTFEQMERSMRDLMDRTLSPGGFDAARDIAGFTVNRWGHGYAYEYARPWDEFWPDGPLPIDTARARFGRVAFANADSGAYAYTNSAIDQAARAVRDLASA